MLASRSASTGKTISPVLLIEENNNFFLHGLNISLHLGVYCAQAIMHVHTSSMCRVKLLKGFCFECYIIGDHCQLGVQL